MQTVQFVIPLSRTQSGIRSLSAIFFAIAIGIAASGILSAQNRPLPIDEARIDISADSMRIDDGWLVPQRGWFGRMDWLPESRRDSSYTVSFPVVDFAETRGVFRFTCNNPGQLTVELKGPWRPSSTGALQKVEIEWLSLDVAGAKVLSAPTLPANAWHDEPLICKLKCEANAAVRLEAVARVGGPKQPAPATAPPEGPIFDLARKFRRGVNLGNFLEVPPGQDWGDNRCRDADYAAIAREGFDHVRIPIGWHHFSGPGPKFEISELFFRSVEEQLDLAEKHGLAAIINLHHFDEFTSRPQERSTQLKKIWQQIAMRFAKRPHSLAFEILNEPKDEATTEIMNRIYADVISAIRIHDADRPILVGPGRFNSCDELPKLDLPPDDRLIVTVHLYEPHLFTHQGAPWGGDAGKVRGIQFPGPPIQRLATPDFANDHVSRWLRMYNELPAVDNPCGMAEVESRLDWAQKWGQRHSRPIHLGEFGAYTVADLRSRTNYLHQVRLAAEKRGMGWAVWDWKASFGYWDRRQDRPIEGLHDALFR